ncbi:hypothetical protein E2C01_050856 [Portunus trituberculatus]|uniref:Uncharacterized protein n=1 Tax=Portunus trituberculatus TaxID=210409 RepID=A0A5B7G9E9_PORTR|nr:hypothetical protein [Portunus trituberculatus]
MSSEGVEEESHIDCSGVLPLYVCSSLNHPHPASLPPPPPSPPPARHCSLHPSSLHLATIAYLATSTYISTLSVPSLSSWVLPDRHSTCTSAPSPYSDGRGGDGRVGVGAYMCVCVIKGATAEM